MRLGRLPGVGFRGGRLGKAAQMLGMLEGPKGLIILLKRQG